MKTQYTKDFDLVIVGAGFAGVSAALAAARQGLKVALLEKQTIIGGLATAGFIFVYLPLCDGNKHQVTFGIAEELLHAGLKYSPYDLSQFWGGKGKNISNSILSEGEPNKCASAPRDRYAVQFTPAAMTLAMDELLKKAKVELWLDTRLCAVRTRNGNVTAIEVENDSGRGLLKAKRFIDASGDAHLVRYAGGAFVRGSNMNHMWLVGCNSLADSSYSLGKPALIQTIPGRTELWTAKLTGKEFTDFVREGWQFTRDFYDQIYQRKADRYSVYPVALPAMPQFRTTARIEGEATITTGEYNLPREDSIGLIGDWRYDGRIWETPYGTLIPKSLGNTLVAGRCIASDADSWEAYRVIPACTMTGEVAGIAAALSLKKRCQPRELPLSLLRRELQKKGFIFHAANL